MTKTKRYFEKLLIALGLFCISCDPSLRYVQIITNNTSEELNLVLESIDIYHLDLFFSDDSYYFNEDSTILFINVKIEPESSDTIYYLSTIGTVDEIDSCKCEYINMRFSDTDYTIVKDIMNSDNWTKEITEEESNGAGVINCTFEINEDDLLEKK